MTMEQHIGGIMGGISNVSEMEAMLNFKEKEIEQLKIQTE